MKVMVLQGHDRPVNVVRFTRPGDLFFTGSAGSKVNLWKSFTGERLGSYITQASVKYMDISWDHKYILVCSLSGVVQALDIVTGSSIGAYSFKSRKIKYVQFSQGGKDVILLAEDYKSNNQIWVYNSKLLLQILMKGDKAFQETAPPQPHLVISPGMVCTKASWRMLNEGFTVSTVPGIIINYDQQGNQICRSQVSKGQIKSFAFAPDYSLLMTASIQGSKALDPQTFQIIRTFKQEVPMNSVAFSPLFCSRNDDLRYHCVMGGGIPAYRAAQSQQGGYQIHLCNVMYETSMGRVSGHFGPINSLQYFPDGRGFVSGGQQGITRVWRFNQDFFKDQRFK